MRVQPQRRGRDGTPHPSGSCRCHAWRGRIVSTSRQFAVPALIVTSIVRAPSLRRPAFRRARPTARYGLAGGRGRRCRAGCRRTPRAAPPRPKRWTHAAALRSRGPPEPLPSGAGALRSRCPPEPLPDQVQPWFTASLPVVSSPAAPEHVIRRPIARVTAVLMRAAWALGGPHKICRCGAREPKVLLSRYRPFPAFHCRLTLNAQ